MSPRPIVLALGACLLGETVLCAVLLQYTQLGLHQGAPQLLAITSTPLWIAAVVLLSRLRLTARQAALLVLGAGAVLQVAALAHQPSSSDDDYRYMWDAKVQLSGTDPYRYPPSAPQLEHLRDASLFGAPDHCLYQLDPALPKSEYSSTECTSINRPGVRTIYPPVAEGAFTLVRLASFGGQGNHLPLQVAGALGSLAIGWLLLRRGRPWLAALWTWSPIAVIEYGNNAHIDWLATFFVVLAFVASRRTAVVGALVGAAIAVKIYPALVLPALMRRNWLVAVVAAAFVALVYVPHVLAVGTDVIGYLPGYLKENKYDSGERLLLLGQVFDHPLDTIVGLVLIAAVSLWAWLRAPRDAPEKAAVLVVGVAFCVFTPSYGWYAGILLALVALSGAIEWVPIALAPTLAYLFHAQIDQWFFTAAFGLTVVIALVRYRDGMHALRRRLQPSL